MFFVFQTIPSLLDDELDACLSKHSDRFWSNRTIEELRERWFQMRQQSLLNDQLKACSSTKIKISSIETLLSLIFR